MKYQKEENTKIRFEKDGIYVMNSKYQTKDKITDIENKGKLLYKAIHSEEIKETKDIKQFIKKKYIIPLKSYEEEFEDKTIKHTSNPIYMTLGMDSEKNMIGKVL